VPRIRFVSFDSCFDWLIDWLIDWLHSVVVTITFTGQPPNGKTWKSLWIWRWSGKSQGKWKKSGKMCFACGVLPWLRWSQNKHSLTARVLLYADDMMVMKSLSGAVLLLDLQCKKFPFYQKQWFDLTQNVQYVHTCFPVHSQVHLGLSVYCHRYVVNIWKSPGKAAEFDEDWKVATMRSVETMQFTILLSAQAGSPRENILGCSHVWNKTEIKLKQIYFISADHRQHCFISVLFPCLARETKRQNNHRRHSLLAGFTWQMTSRDPKRSRSYTISLKLSISKTVRERRLVEIDYHISWNLWSRDRSCLLSQMATD